jgi:hypothetical protein
MATSLQGNDDGVGFGVKGEATGGDGVVGTTRGIHKVGVRGVHTGHISAIAIRGDLERGTAAVKGQVGGGSGVGGDEVINSGVWGDSSQGPGVSGLSSVAEGLLGEGTVGVRGVGIGGGLAGRFEGNVEVTGDISLTNADCAEDFNVSTSEFIEPGTVMVIDDSGKLRPCLEAYDKRVGGVTSGAGDRRPGIILGRQESNEEKVPVALLGRVYCRVDARYSAIEVGDLLTTSATPGHAMKAEDARRAFGAVIGKALCSLATGQGLVPILVALQ